MYLQEQIEKGKKLISQGKCLGKDTTALEERVKVLEAQLKERLHESPYNRPAWYTDEDRKAVAILQGICKTCTHLLLVKDNSTQYEFKGIWCAALRVKLEVKVESCPKFYALGDEIDRLTKQMGIK